MPRLAAPRQMGRHASSSCTPSRHRHQVGSRWGHAAGRPVQPGPGQHQRRRARACLGVPTGLCTARTPGGRLQTTHGCGLLAAEDMERCGHRTAQQFTDGGDGHWRATAGTAGPAAAYRPPCSGQFLTWRGGDAVAEAEAGSSVCPVRPWAMFRVLPSLRVRVLESPLLVFLGPGGGGGQGPASRWPTACGCVWLEGSWPGLGWPSVSHRGWVPALRYL